jgi:LPS O-antigen subunit length determinant protein (WzzB/FepE family)
MTDENHRLESAEPSAQPDDAGEIEDTLSRQEMDTQKNINESHDKIRLKTQLKRGSDTRDQDTHDVKARGETPEEAAKNLSETIAELEERNVFERVRNIQPEVDDDE